MIMVSGVWVGKIAVAVIQVQCEISQSRITDKLHLEVLFWSELEEIIN